METNDVPVRHLERLITDKFGSPLKIVDLKWQPLTGPGENFGSVIYAIDVTVVQNKENENLHLVVKLPPPTQYFLDLFNSPVTFWKELDFYRTIVPALHEFESESGIEDCSILDMIPRYYGGRLGLKDPKLFDDQAAIVIENLLPRGYIMQDRLVGLDKVRTELTVKALAKLHALGIGLKVKKPQSFEEIVMPGLVSASNHAAKQGVLGMIQQSYEQLKNIPEAAPYMDRIEKTLKYDYDGDYEDNKPTEPWGTVIHNDCWTNNILFKHDENNKPIELKIVDFQLCFYDYGVKEFIFFIVSSAQKYVLDNHLDEMIDLYYDSFIGHLKALNIDTEKFSRSEFDKLLLRCGPEKFGQCIMMILVTMRPKKNSERTEVNQDQGEFLNIGDNKLFSDKLLHTLRIFDKKHWLVD